MTSIKMNGVNKSIEKFTLTTNGLIETNKNQNQWILFGISIPFIANLLKNFWSFSTENLNQNLISQLFFST